MSDMKYFTPNEVSLHVTEDDLWVSFFGKVIDLSPLCRNKDNDTIFALLSFAGKDISHLFDEHGEVKLHVDPNTNQTDNFLPFKSFPGVPSQTEAENLYLERKERDEKISETFIQKYMCQRLGQKHEPSTSLISYLDKQPEIKADTLPWWKDQKYVIGLLTRKARRIKIMNTMIMKEVTLECINRYMYIAECRERISETFIQKYMCQRLGQKHEPSTSFVFHFEKQPNIKADTFTWWKDQKYIIGFPKRKARRIKIMNTMIMKEVVLEVCSEDTIEDILERYLKFNRHVHSYTWKYFGEKLNMKQTLDENGIPDEDEQVDRLRLNSDDFIPTLFLYFNHDLTEM